MIGTSWVASYVAVIFNPEYVHACTEYAGIGPQVYSTVEPIGKYTNQQV